MANLFTDSFFRKQMEKIKAELGIDESQLEKYRETVQKRIDYVIDFNPETDSEEKDWPGFERDVFHDLLGYRIKDDDPSDYNIFRQSKVKGAGKGGGTGKTDCTLGFYSKKKERDGNDPVIVEFKAPDTKNLNAAADQLWNYMIRNENCRWGIVTNFNEIILYHRNRGRDRKQRFYFAVPDELNEKISPLVKTAKDDSGNITYDCSELIKFLAIFRKDRLISQQGESVTDRMLSLQGTEEKEIEKKFYAKYYRLRIDLFNEIAGYNPQYRKKREELVAITQKILDRLIFVWFCEDSREELLPRSILQRLIGSLMKKSPDLRSENDVWEEIRRLFKAVDDGKGFNIGNGYNGELFKPDQRIDELVIPNRIFEQQVKPIGEEYDFGHENELSVNILGHIFEQSVSDLEDLKKGEPADKKTGKRKRDGVYYTPEYITRYIVDQALGGWLAERRKELGEDSLPELTDQVKKKNPKNGKRKIPAGGMPKFTQKMLMELENATGNRKLTKHLAFLKTTFKDEDELREALAVISEAQQYTDMIVEMAMPKDTDLEKWYRLEKYWRSYREVLKNVKILDPACGSGAFLIQAFDYLHEEGQKVNQAMDELGIGNGDGNENIFDLDRQILENNLHGVDINTESVEITKLSLWLKTADRHKKLNRLFNNIKCGNSLIDDSKVAGKKAFKWEKEFPEIMKNGGFDVVIGNPPYGILIKDTEQNYFREKFPLTTYKINLYILFIERMFQIFQKGTIHFIIPKSLLFNTYYAKLRYFMITNCYIEEILSIEEKVFEDAEVGGSLLIKFVLGRHFNSNKNVRMLSIKNITGKMIFNEIPQKKFLENDNYEISMSSSENYSILAKLNKLNSIKDFFILKNGLNPGNIKHILISDCYKDNKHKPIIWGKNINRYLIDWSGDYINYDEKLRDEISPEDIKSKQGMKKQQRIDFALRTPDIFETEKIVVRKTGDSLIASYDSMNYYFDTLIHGIYAKNKSHSLKWLLCILNSKPATYFYRLLHDIKGKVFAKISLDNLASYKIPKLDIDKQIPFIEKTNLMLDLNRQLSEQKQSLSEYLTVNHNIDKFPQKLRHPEHLEFADFIKELKKKKIGTDDKTVYESFKDFHTKIRELKSEIDKTDREIDQMVYDLYGLTDEERAVVEKSCA
ncbi:MAG: N-6 DNA methylase [Desulfococcaceae bacterium]